MKQAFERKMSRVNLVGMQTDFALRCYVERSLNLEGQIDAFVHGARLFDCSVLRGELNVFQRGPRICKYVVVQQQRDCLEADSDLGRIDAHPEGVHVIESDSARIVRGLHLAAEPANLEYNLAFQVEIDIADLQFYGRRGLRLFLTASVVLR